MPYTEIPCKPHSKKWHALRAKGVGASDAGAILGLNRYRSPLDVWLEKTGRKEPDDLNGNTSVEWGLRLEDVIAKKFADEHPEYKVVKPKGTFVSTEHPFMLANLDFIIIRKTDGARGILEIKTGQYYTEWLDDEGNEVIPSYLAQVAHQYAVSGFEFAYVAALIRGREYIEREYVRDEDDITDLISRESDFWVNYVEKGVTPELVGLGDEAQSIFLLHSEPTTDIALIDDPAMELLMGYRRIHIAESTLKKQKQEYANAIKLILGDSASGENEFVKVTWKRYEKKYFDKDALAKDHPELIEKYTKKKPHNGGLTITWKEGDRVGRIER